MTTISIQQRGIVASGKNSSFPKLSEIAAARELSDFGKRPLLAGKLAQSLDAIPVVGRVAC